MELSQLEFFVTVVHERGFSKAAERVFRTQPAVSIAIRRLEEEIGTPLFERSAKAPVLTEAGQIFYDYAQRILALRDQALGVVGELRALKRGRVRVGANESTSLYFLPHLILDYRARYPQVMVEISRQTSERLPREVLDRNVDFALMAYHPPDSQLESFPVLRDPLVLIVYPEHPLAARDAVNVEELGSEPFLAHNVKTGSRYKVTETFAAHHTPLNITLELATVETIKRFVQLRIGVAFVPRMCVEEELERGTLISVPVVDLSYVRTLWVTRRKGVELSPAATTFLEILREHARSISRSEESTANVATSD